MYVADHASRDARMAPSESRRVATAMEMRRLMRVDPEETSRASATTRNSALSSRVVYTVLSSGGSAAELRIKTFPTAMESHIGQLQLDTARRAARSAEAAVC